MSLSKRWTYLVSSLLASLLAAGIGLAQDYPTDQGPSAAAGTETWYTQPWVWIVGVAVFLLVVIALTNRGGRTRV